ncbi:MAG: FAD-dependent oxidoreductase [Eubacteriales bacterium]|nr:FAD-dependent oxidoreductase [Eubacteriales bacterium]
MRIIVVGANHAGTAAINTMLSHYPDAEVIVYDRNSNISFLGCGMALWIGEQIGGSEGLFYSSPEKLRAGGAEVNMEAEVLDILPEEKEVLVRLKDGTERRDHYDKLILATGSLPIDIPNLKGMDLENVFHVKLFQDAQAVIDALEQKEVQKVAVIGAGYIGVELAEAFERKGKEVILIDAADTCLSTYYDKTFTDLMEENLKKHNIELRFGEKLTALEGDGKLQKVVTDKGSYDVDMAVLCIGFKPNTALAKDKLETFRNGAYLVNRRQETSDPNILAVGDCATLFDNSINDSNYIALATNAVRSGIVGAHNACGTKLESIGVQGSNGICIYDLKMVSTGLTVEKAKRAGIEVKYTDFEDLQKPAFIESKNPPVKIRIVYRADNRQVVGAQMASEWDMSMGIHFFSLAIQEHVTIDKLALTDIFFLPHFNQPYNYITMAAISAE